MIMKLRLPRWNDVLVGIYKSPVRWRYSEKLNKIVKASRSHVQTIVKRLASSKLIQISPRGNTKQLILTGKGEKVSEAIMRLRAEMGEL